MKRSAASFKPRPTVYNGIKMRSRLEAGFAQWLDKNGWDWEYEPTCFASDRGQYLPDFLIRNLRFVGDQQALSKTYVEVKPTLDDIPALWLKMSVVWDSEPDAWLLICAPPTGHPAHVQAILTTNRMGNIAQVDFVYALDGPPQITIAMPADDGPWHGDWWSVT